MDSDSLLCHDNKNDKTAKYGSFRTVDTETGWSDCTPSTSGSESDDNGTPHSVSDPVTIEDLHEITVIPVADEHGHLAHYPGEEQDHLHRERYLHHEEDIKKVSLFESCIDSFKCLYSTGLFLVCVVLVMAAIFTRQTDATDAGVPPIVAFVVFWFLVVWLALMEGGQSCLVGLQPIDKTLYAHSHPRTLISTVVAHKGDNMERFIVGRQFLILLIVFITNLMASTIVGTSVLGLSPAVIESFLGSGIAITLICIMVGQSAQINASNCMLDFINNYFWVFTTYCSLILDMSGLLHSVYLFQYIFSKITGSPVESDEPPRTSIQNFFFWVRVAFSCGVLGYSFAVTLTALFNGQTTMYAGVPSGISVILLFFLLCFLGVLEGMQIALFSVVNLPAEDLKDHPLAAKSCEITFQGSNLQAFLIGRQMCATFCQFIIARITSCDVHADLGEATIFHANDTLEALFNTGMLGAIITTIVGSLVWRILASSFPVAFLSNPAIYGIIRLCLFVENTGICSVAWVLAVFQKQFVFRYELDEVYIGTAEERTAATRRSSEGQDLEQQCLLQDKQIVS